MSLRKVPLYLHSFLIIMTSLSSLKSFCAEEETIDREIVGLFPQKPVFVKEDHPQVAEYPENFRQNFLVLPNEEGSLLIPQGLTSLEAKPKPKRLEDMPDGTLLKTVAYVTGERLALFAGSKKESKKLAEALGEYGHTTVERTNKKGKKVQITKLRTLHHTSFNDWGPVYTAGVLYKTDGTAYFHVESGKYGFDQLSRGKRIEHLEFMQALLSTFYHVTSEIVTKEIQVEARNPSSLLPFEKTPDEGEEVILKTMLLLKIDFPDTN